MKIGVPRERKTLEKRVALTPDGAVELIKRGHRITVEKGAGEGSFFSDSEYVDAGCSIAQSLQEVWASDLVVKVKEPDAQEFQYFRDGLVLFDYLHLASLPEVATALNKSKVTAFAYELVSTAEGRLPLLEPMSEIAGKLAVQNGAYFLQSQNGGRGILLGGAVGVAPGEVVIIGAGIAGRSACDVAVGMGAHVTVLDINRAKLEALAHDFGSAVSTVHSTRAALARACSNADLLIAAVLIPGAATPRLVTKEMIASMPKGSVFVDVSIDQGGCAETIKPTSLKDPVYVVDDVIHYGVTNMPAQTPRTSTLALTSATLPYIVKLAARGAPAALEESAELKRALSCYEGSITNLATAEALGLSCREI